MDKETHQVSTFENSRQDSSLEDAKGEGLSEGYLQYRAPVHDPAKVRRLVRKLDILFIPLVFILYTWCFLDRASVGAAGIAGFKEDLHLHGTQYNTGLSLFFVGYIVFQGVNNIIMKKVGPRIWLTVLTASFAAITIGTAFIGNYKEYWTVRFLLGMVEGGVLSGIALMLSMYYTREELTLRIACYMIAPNSSGAFGGLLAYGLIQIGDKGRLKAWSWIFLVEGIISMALAATVFLLVPRDRNKAWFLNSEEQQIQRERMKESDGGQERQEATTWRLVWRALSTPLFLVNGLTYICISYNVQSIAIFLPTILRGFGYSVLKSQLYSVWPNLLGTFTQLGIVYAVHRTRHTGFWIVGSCLCATIGYGMLLSANLDVAYGGTFVASLAGAICGPLLVGWNAKNAAPATVRAIAIAMAPSLGHLGAIAASYAYRAEDAPRYITGNASNCALGGTAALMALGTMAYIQWENKQRDAGRRDYRVTGNDEEDMKLGNEHPSYRYAL